MLFKSSAPLLPVHYNDTRGNAHEEKETFILIDDDPISCFICKKIIARTFQSINLVTFTCPVKGLEYLEDCNRAKQGKTVLFLDIHMPVLKGWDILEKIKNFDDSFKSRLIVFILSSSLDPSDVLKAKVNPLVTSYFQKPLEEEHLKKVMELMKLMVW
jgi:response regulator RpfG family c-di-GMP phosphodiesterase